MLIRFVEVQQSIVYVEKKNCTGWSVAGGVAQKTLCVGMEVALCVGVRREAQFAHFSHSLGNLVWSFLLLHIRPERDPHLIVI